LTLSWLSGSGQAQAGIELLLGEYEYQVLKHNGLLPMQIILNHVDKEMYHWMTGVFSFS